MKKILSIILALLMFASLPMAFSAEGEDTSDSKTKREIVEEFKNGLQIGTWVPYVVTDEATQTMSENGIDFTFLGIGSDIGIETVERCEKYGIQCIISDWRLYPQGDRINLTVPSRENFDAVFSGEVINNPAVIGYNIYDEPYTEGLGKIGETIDIFREYSSDLIPFVNLYPNVVYNTQDYLNYLDTYITETKNDFISFDIYPLLETNVTEKNYYINLSQVSKAARENNIDFWVFVQSMPFNNRNRAPSLNDMLFQMYSSLSFGATKLMHFCYGTPASGVETFPYGIVDADGNKTELWDITKKANDEIHAIGDAYMKYKVNQHKGY